MWEKSIDDYWNVDEDRDLSDTWTGFTCFRILDEKNTGWIFMVLGETDKKTNDLQARHFVARDLERYVRSVEAKTRAKEGYRKNRSLTVLENCVVFTSLILRMRNSQIL